MVYFDGFTYEPDKDLSRLKGQLLRVTTVMLDGQWHTLRDLADRAAPGSEASVSARLRDLRKPRFGAWEVERMRVGGGLFAYRLSGVPSAPKQPVLL